MLIILVALHVIVCVFLILVVLLQTGKGADLAGAFGGGGSQTAFGARGASTLLTKLTTASAILFMLTSMILALLSKSTAPSVLEGVSEEAGAAAPATPGPTAPGEDGTVVPPAGDGTAEETGAQAEDPNS